MTIESAAVTPTVAGSTPPANTSPTNQPTVAPTSEPPTTVTSICQPLADRTCHAAAATTTPITMPDSAKIAAATKW